MPFRHQQPSRVDRVRCAVQNRAADAAQTLSGAAGTAAGAAGGAARSAAGAAQDAASLAADRAGAAAHQVADRAADAAGALAQRARPLAAEAVGRGSAAWRVLRYGAPPSPMARVASVVPVAVVTKAARRSKAPMALMALGAAGAIGVLWVRRARTGRDSVWILDDDNDVEPVGRWDERDSRANAVDDMDLDLQSRDHGERAGRMEREAGGGRDGGSSGERKDSPVNRWP
jgi:hypothetical protein